MAPPNTTTIYQTTCTVAASVFSSFHAFQKLFFVLLRFSVFLRIPRGTNACCGLCPSAVKGDFVVQHKTVNFNFYHIRASPLPPASASIKHIEHIPAFSFFLWALEVSWLDICPFDLKSFLHTAQTNTVVISSSTRPAAFAFPPRLNRG